MKKQLELIKSQHELIKSIKSQQKLTKQTQSQRELLKSQRKLKRLIKAQQTLSSTKEIRNHLYNIENKNNNNNNNNNDFIENVRDLFNIVNYEPILIKTGFDNNNNYYYCYNCLEYRSEGNDSLSFEEYLNLMKPYLNDLINNKKDEGKWKLQLSAEISFVSQKPDSDEKHVMYTRSICEEIMIGSETEEITEKLIMSLLQKY